GDTVKRPVGGDARLRTWEVEDLGRLADRGRRYSGCIPRPGIGELERAQRRIGPLVEDQVVPESGGSPDPGTADHDRLQDVVRTAWGELAHVVAVNEVEPPRLASLHRQVPGPV